MLSDSLNSRQNNLWLIRLLAAIAVVYGHCYPLANILIKNAHTPDPIFAPIINYMAFGKAMSGLAVAAFFFVSGFLIAKSYDNQSWRNFWAARILRIFPALWCNLLFCVTLGWLVSGFALVEFFTHPQTTEYIWLNATLLRPAFTLPNVFVDLPWGGGINGSLWTLPLEFRMYLFCFIVGLTKILTTPKLFNAFFTLLLIYFIIFAKLPFLDDSAASALPLNFLLGMFCFASAKYICLNLKWLILLLLICVISYNYLPRNCYDLSFSITFGYAILLLAYKKYAPHLDLSRYGDFSYGIYLYGYPIQQLIIYLHNGVINPLLLFLYAMVALAPIVMISWFLIELPAMQLLKKLK
jgi:peptidoglycan/LPS O-acetylase OafA/YrhL